ncbi:hypothetical protein ATJ88_0469 [Isoptericola jiangsuensis]|uniref:Uncharacterized protein n=1 Tax=Isoptericola jiangsuensis TaxID=548579 RepID=A0A2A9ETD0_9MICO|nr:hypothetical protein [Isoptericola jiangsuensis]PFG41826.1 hypothetical protein ATJ88_0469 [Isoptericola jiangsuensis]
MRRMMWTAGAVVLGDGMLLGASAALGWIALVVLAVLVGLGGALFVARNVPAGRTPARPATVTLGVPMREAPATTETDGAPALGTPVAAPTPVAA